MNALTACDICGVACCHECITWVPEWQRNACGVCWESEFAQFLGEVEIDCG